MPVWFYKRNSGTKDVGFSATDWSLWSAQTVRCYLANSTQFQHIANCWIWKQEQQKKERKKSLKKLITKTLRETLLMNRNWRVVQKMVHSMHGWPSGKKEVKIWLQPNAFSIFSFRLEKKIEKYN